MKRAWAFGLTSRVLTCDTQRNQETVCYAEAYQEAKGHAKADQETEYGLELLQATRLGRPFRRRLR